MAGIFSTVFGNKLKPIDLDAASFEDQVKQDGDAVLLDVRTPMENNQARIPNSKLIDISSPSFLDEIESLDKSKSYYVYCRSGNRSYHAGVAMLKMGFENVYNLAPGIIGWKGQVESGN